MVLAIVRQPKLPMKLVSRFITIGTKSSGYLIDILYFETAENYATLFRKDKRIAIKKSLLITTLSLPVKFICIQK